jgi:hypothetical protein
VIRLKIKALRSLTLAKYVKDIRNVPVKLNLRSKTEGLLYVAAARKCPSKRMIKHLWFLKYSRRVRINRIKRTLSERSKQIKKTHIKSLTHKITIDRLCGLFDKTPEYLEPYEYQSPVHFRTE